MKINQWFSNFCLASTIFCFFNMPMGLVHAESDQDSSKDSNIWLTDLSAAQAQAKAENKPLLMDFTGSDWCGWCMKLKREVFSKSAFIDYARKNLVLLEVDFPQQKPQSEALKQQNAKLQDQYKIEGYPTIIVLSPQGKLLGQLGYEEGGPEHWLKDLQGITK